MKKATNYGGLLLFGGGDGNRTRVVSKIVERILIQCNTPVIVTHRESNPADQPAVLKQ